MGIKFIFLCLFFLFTGNYLLAQKVIVGVHTSIIGTAIHLKENITIGDTITLYQTKTKLKPAILPGLNLSYELKSKSKITASFKLFKEKIDFDCDYKDSTDSFDPSKTIKLNWRKLDVCYEQVIRKQRSGSFYVKVGLGYLWKKKTPSSSRFFVDQNAQRNLYTRDMDKAMGNEINQLGSCINADISLAYKKRKFIFYLGFGKSILSINNKSTNAKIAGYIQGGLRYDLFTKTIQKDQYSKQFSNNITLKTSIKSEVGIIVKYSVLTSMVASGHQTYFYADGHEYYYTNQDTLYSAVAFQFSDKPQYSVSPELGLQYKRYLKTSGLVLRGQVSFQTLKLNYKNAKISLLPGTSIMERSDEKDIVGKINYLIGIEKQFLKKEVIHPFIAIDFGFNQFTSGRNFRKEDENYTLNTVDNSGLVSFRKTFSASLGAHYKRFSLGAEYNSIPNRFNTTDNFVLRNMTQIKIALTYNFNQTRF